jgi:hypothetical protein
MVSGKRENHSKRRVSREEKALAGKISLELTRINLLFSGSAITLLLIKRIRSGALSIPSNIILPGFIAIKPSGCSLAIEPTPPDSREIYLYLSPNNWRTRLVLPEPLGPDNRIRGDLVSASDRILVKDLEKCVISVPPTDLLCII